MNIFQEILTRPCVISNYIFCSYLCFLRPISSKLHTLKIDVEKTLEQSNTKVSSRSTLKEERREERGEKRGE